MHKLGKNNAPVQFQKDLAFYGGAFCLALAAVGAAFAVGGYAPFGDKSVAVGDGFNQYLDFFAYLKELMSGNASALYSFSKTLGGDAVAIFSYYLASPLNLLIVFFRKDQLVLFYHLLCALKMALAAAFCAVFLRKRFAGKLGYLPAGLLAIGYGLCHYNMAQCRNVMWLDGVYMLPLILLGVWTLVTRHKTTLLSVTVGLALLFNWYSGAVACLFGAMWLVLEWLLACPEKGKRVHSALRCLIQYFYGMLFGIGLSAVLFWPSVLALRRGRASVDWQSLELGLHANPLQFFLQSFTVGAADRGALGVVSLACGALAVLGCIGLFASKKVTRGQKTIFGLFAACVVLLFYWGPARFLFCLLKDVGSYWYRYSFVGSFAVVFLAAFYFAAEGKTAFHARRIALCTVGAAGVILLLHCIWPTAETVNVLVTAGFLAAAGVGLLIWEALQKHHPSWARAAAGVLVAVLCAEGAANGILTWKNYGATSAAETAGYVAQQQAQTDALKACDAGLYRVHQTDCRTYPDYHREKNLSSNYNEALAYDYWSISGFTSSTDAAQLDFFDRLGYNRTNENLCVTNTPILAADSLLGVKYYLMKTPLSCLTAVDGIAAANGRTVAENPYALPFAFTYSADASAANDAETDPFVYQNALFSQLLGETVELYKSASVVGMEQISDKEVSITVDTPEGNYILYGILNGCPVADLYADNAFQTGYQDQRAPTMIYADGGGQHRFLLHSEDGISMEDLCPDALNVANLNFCYLDVDLLAEVSQKLNARAAQQITVEDGYAACTVQGTAGENVYLSIPYDSGWTITRNGETVAPTLVGGCMISVPLAEGENQIVLRYRAPGFRTGALASAGCLVLLCAAAWLEKKRLAAKPTL
ncbi:MAG: YfhO family protein [Faecalibacterium sp.]|jgi:uncharacterized membrane protein YfhO|nr:YfhO family protein [Faecalibacterium sp.]